jgi:DNA-binding response OmpR family regulator
VDGRVSPIRPEPPRVLVVDDCETSLRFQEYALAGRFEVRTARSGDEALAAARRERFDLVVLDLGLPDTPGLEVLRALRESDGAPPVVVLTVQGSATSREEARQRGCAAYLTKPITFGELLREIRKHLPN